MKQLLFIAAMVLALFYVTYVVDRSEVFETEEKPGQEAAVDVKGAKEAFGRLRRAYRQEDRKAVHRLMTRRSQAKLLRNPELGTGITDVELLSLEPYGDYVFMKVRETRKDGSEHETLYVFVKEGDDWKLDISRTEYF